MRDRPHRMASRDLPGHNWTCGDQPTDTPTQRLAHTCQYVARVDRLIGQPDVIDIAPFTRFDEFDSPGLMAFFVLMSINQTPAGAIPVQNILCNRTPPSTVGSPSANSFYNKWYKGTTVTNLSCANHSPARAFRACTTKNDCYTPSEACVSGRCQGGFCGSQGDCMPWENCTQQGCATIQASCNPSDPFGFGNCPVGSYCNPNSNGGECWRL
jgi:hypothetical protein